MDLDSDVNRNNQKTSPSGDDLVASRNDQAFGNPPGLLPSGRARREKHAVVQPELDIDVGRGARVPAFRLLEHGLQLSHQLEDAKAEARARYRRWARRPRARLSIARTRPSAFASVGRCADRKGPFCCRSSI